jgi:putative transposase
MNSIKNKLNKRIRLENWNYADSAYYFVTMCTKERIPFFGEVVSGNMNLNEIGLIVAEEWRKTPGIRSDMNLEIDEFVVMPDHFHGIIVFGQNEFNGDKNKINQNRFGPQSKNLASVMRGFKSSVTTRCKKSGYTSFGWQSRFYEHIIRHERALHRIRNYIRYNPINYKKGLLGPAME